MCVTGSHDQAGRHSCHAIPGRHSGQGRRCTLARPVPGWTVIQVYGEIKPGDLATFVRYRKTSSAATLVIVTARAATSAGIGMGLRVHLKKLIVGVKGNVRLVMCPGMDRWGKGA